MNGKKFRNMKISYFLQLPACIQDYKKVKTCNRHHRRSLYTVSTQILLKPKLIPVRNQTV